MEKKIHKKLNSFILKLTVLSFVITLLEGGFFYASRIDHGWFWLLMVLENGIRVFGFDASISIGDMLVDIETNPWIVKTIVGYLYGIAIFAAPYCTVMWGYRVVERLFRIRFVRSRKKADQNILIFGCNEEVKSLLANSVSPKEHRTRGIQIVSEEELSEEESLEWMDRKIRIHKCNVLGMSPEELQHFGRQVHLEQADVIILYEECSAKNFSLYHLLSRQMIQKTDGRDRAHVKFFCRCEDDGIRKMLEDAYDTTLRRNEATDTGKRAQGEFDMEIVSIPELRVRKLLQEHSLHAYYEVEKARRQGGCSLAELDQWSLHLLILGFGKLGQQILLQAMNLGVVTDRNPILVDVVDFRMEEKSNIFFNNFSEDYVVFSGQECVIPSDRADGQCRIRFHQMDVRYQQFQKQLRRLGDPKEDGIFTYIAICMEDMEISLHCVSEVKRYLGQIEERKRKAPSDARASFGRPEDVRIGIRMEADRSMAQYLQENTHTYKNVFVIQDSGDTLSLEDLIHDKLDRMAREFHGVYSKLSLNQRTEEGGDQTEEKADDTPGDVSWSRIELFKRNANRALACHRSVLEEILEGREAELLRCFGPEGIGSCYRQMDGKMQIDDDAFLGLLQREPFFEKMTVAEHRRWCYFMASCGWSFTQGEKDSEKRESPCMCTWADLVQNQKETCKYDMMPLLYQYKHMQTPGSRSRN